MTSPPPWSDPVRPWRRSDGVTRYDGISYAIVRGVRPLLLDLWVPPSDAPPPVVVWIHGGAWREGDRRYLPPTMVPDSLFEKAVAAGLAIATVDYRLSGEASFPVQLHDVKAAIRYLRHHAGALGIDASRIGAGGESAGGHLAALAALTPDASGDLEGDLEGDVGVTGPSSRLACVVPWYALLDARPLDLDDADDVVAALLGGRSAELARRASPAAYVTADAPPFLLIHGDADAVVPVEQSERMDERLRAAGAPSEFVRVPGAEHCFDGYPDIDALLDRTVAFWASGLMTE
jgi:acetyl esterase/lipase